MWKHKLTTCLSFTPSPHSSTSPVTRLSLIAVVCLSWLLTFSTAMAACPKTCQCVQSRQEMSCLKGKMTDLVADLDHKLKHVTLDGVNGLEALSLSDLEPLKTTLLTLKIKDSGVKTIPSGTFSGFTQLEKLDLSGNELMTLEAESFSGISHLTALNLSGNQLLNLGSSLAPLSSLESLDLSDNSLQVLHDGVFANQTLLRRLFVSGNQLKNLNSDSLKGLDRIRELHLRDCSLASIPDDLFEGKQALRDLDLGQNRLASFLSPKMMSHLSFLSSLHFDNNEVQKLTKYLFTGVHLQLLDLSYNRINLIDDLAFENSSLKVLDLSYNMVLSLSQSFLRPMSVHINGLSLAGNPMGELPPNVFSELKLLKKLNISSCSLDTLKYHSFQDLSELEELDLSHNKLHSIPENMIDFIENLRVVNLHQNPWVCDCHIKPLSKWLKKSQSVLKMYCPVSRSKHQDCTKLRCVSPSHLNEKLLADLTVEDMGKSGCRGDKDSDGLPTGIQGAIVASCMGVAIILLIITVYLWKRGRTGYGLKRVCVPSDAESSHVVDEDSKVPPLSNCDRASLNESDHSFVVRHYFDTLVTDPKLMSRTSDSEEPTSPKERDSLYSSQPSLYSNHCPPLGIESTV